jgi:replicative DNA helicase
MPQENILPYNLDAEQGVLGSILIDPEGIVQVVDSLQPEYFYRDAHRIIYRAIVTLYKQRLPADFITLCDELEKQRGEKQSNLEIVGGSSYISSLINVVPTSGNIDYYADIVIRTWTHRALIQAAGEIAAAGYAQEEHALATAEKKIFEIGQGTSGQPVRDHVEILDTYMTALMELHEQHKDGTLTGIPTGFPLLNKYLGGFRPSKMYVFAARPGDGKTALLLNFIDEAVASGCNVLFFSLEMDESELMQRWIAMRARIDSKKLRDGHLTDDMDEMGDTEWERVMKAHKEIANLPGKLFIDDTAGNNITAIKSKSLRMQAQHGVDMVCVDYLQMTKGTPGQNYKDKRLEIEEVSQELKNLSRELRVPVIALAQLNRDVDKRADRMPQLSDLKEASGIEQDANVVTFIHKSPDISKDDTTYPVSLVIEKNRDGQKGIIPLQYVGPYTKFFPVKEQEFSHE